MAKLADVQGLDVRISKEEVDYQNLPEQFGIRTPLPQPGPGYVLRMPTITPNDDNWLDGLENGDGKPRIGYEFKEGKELLILQAPAGEGVGQALRFRITNQERKFGKDSEEKSAASGLSYLLSGSFGLDLTGKSNKEYAQALIALSGKSFMATVNWTAYCNPKREIYVAATDESEGGKIEGSSGCGQRYALKQRTNKSTGEIVLNVPKDGEGRYVDRFICASENCNAFIMAFLELQNYKPAQGVGAQQVTQGKPQNVASVKGAPAQA